MPSLLPSSAQTAFGNESLSRLQDNQTYLSIPDPASLIFPPCPYPHTDRYNCWTDDNTSCGSLKIVRTSVPGLHPDPLRTHCGKKYPGTACLR